MMCLHKPKCPLGTPTWFCSKRTDVEAAVQKGTITRQAGANLLIKLKVPMSPASKVYAGAKREGERLW